MIENSPSLTSTSVIIPAYNAESSIARAIQSILAQTVPAGEVIVGCDGCTDATARIASELGARVVEIPKANGAAARNAACSVATGEVIFLLDSDDEWVSTKIESHLEAHVRTEASFIIDPSRRIRPGGVPRGLNGAGPEAYLSWKDMAQHSNWSSGSAISVRRKHWDKIHGFNPTLKALQDVDFLVRLAYFCGPGFRIPVSQTRYHLSESGISRQTSWGDEVIDAFAQSCNFLDDQDVLSVKQTIALRNALLAGPMGFWHHILWGHVPFTDTRVWKLYILALTKRIGLKL